MAKKFLVKKDPSMTAENVEWIQMNRTEFKKFIKLEDNKKRRFIPLYDERTMQVDIVIEASESEYKDWKRNFNRSYYVAQYGKDRQVVSLQSVVDKELTLDDTLPGEYDQAPAEAVEETMFVEFVESCIEELPINEKAAINMFIKCGPSASDTECAEKLGWPLMSFRNRKMRALKKIFAKIEK